MSCDEEVAEMAEEERRHEAERMRRKRGTIRGATTRILNQIDVEISQSNPDTDHLSTLLELLSAKEDSLFELDRGIEQLDAIGRIGGRDCMHGGLQRTHYHAEEPCTKSDNEETGRQSTTSPGE